ncbi:MAG TPA: hypothetical protein VIS74_00895, partial [Chthoniobacterales bacterium]
PLALGQVYLEGDLPDNPGYESNSPQELLPALVEPGLSPHAIPSPATPESAGETGFVPLYRLTRPFYDSIFAQLPPQYLPNRDPSGFRSVTVNLPPIGLQPRAYRLGLLEFYPRFGLSQSFDSNVNLTATNEIADFYLTPKAGLEFQIGTPDSIYLEGYDTMLAARGSYEAYGDLFYGHPELSAFNQQLSLAGRIGRSAAIWRPFLEASDLTGSNLLMAELVNRTRRIRVLPGIFAEYKFTERTGGNQTFSYYRFQHTDPQYINTQTWRTEQELTYRVTNDLRAILWAEYRYTEPSAGSNGREYFAGAGWAGKPDPRLYSELRIGWDFLDLEGGVPDRQNLSGLRFNGYTTFDWSPRFRPTFRYDRDYVFNEVDENDNYVSTLLQLKGEIFLGGNWYVTPYFGFSIQEFETSRRITLQWRPELEVSYALPSNLTPNQPRIFAKAACMSAQTVKGSGEPIEDLRFSVGFDLKF